MNLISCTTCGVVLNKKFANVLDMDDADGNHIPGNSEWDDDRYVQLCLCPVCKEKFPVPED